jgi:hypothetical protein
MPKSAVKRKGAAPIGAAPCALSPVMWTGGLSASSAADQLTAVTARRFCDQAASFEPPFAGRSLP